MIYKTKKGMIEVVRSTSKHSKKDILTGNMFGILETGRSIKVLLITLLIIFDKMFFTLK